MNKTISISLPENIVVILKQEAKIEQTSVSDIVKQQLRKWAEDRRTRAKRD